MTLKCTASVSAILACVIAVSAVAQSPPADFVSVPKPNMPPHKMQFDLFPDFWPDPWQGEVEAGGGSNPVDLGFVSNCVGEVKIRPDYNLVWGSGGGDLYFYVRSFSDTVLLVNGPDGRFYCNDDSELGENPLIKFSNARPGRYNIFVGKYHSGGPPVPATLFVSELRP